MKSSTLLVVRLYAQTVKPLSVMRSSVLGVSTVLAGTSSS